MKMIVSDVYSIVTHNVDTFVLGLQWWVFVSVFINQVFN